MSASIRREELPEGLHRLSAELKVRFRKWEEDPGSWPEELFEDVALRAFEVQFEGNAPYRRYCVARGVEPVAVRGWREIPPAPSAAFRTVPLVVGRPEDAALVFRTSGTTGGKGRRGVHLVRDPELYRASLRAGFRRFVLDRLEDRPDLVALQEDFTFRPDSSLSWMLDDVRRAFGGAASECVARPEGIDWVRLEAIVERAVREERPLCLVGTTLAFAAWLDILERDSAFYVLPSGSGVMDTGGSKGRGGVERETIVAGLTAHLGIAPARIVNEFGMTELLSQRYDEGAAAPSGPGGGRVLFGPPWLQTRALDPATLEELPPGEVGVLCHFDLANLGSVCHVLTEDLGRVVGDGVEWLGRASGSPPRGCSLATAELLAAQEEAG